MEFICIGLRKTEGKLMEDFEDKNFLRYLTNF